MQEDFLYGVNEVLIKIIQNVLSEYNIQNLIVKEKYSLENYKNVKELFDECIVIGDSTVYQMLQSEKNVKFCPYNNIALYCDSDELQKLQEAIFIYASENEYEIEIYYEDNIDDVISMIKYDNTKNIAILLTTDEFNKKKFENSIADKKIYINENPFKMEVSLIYNYLK